MKKNLYPLNYHNSHNNNKISVLYPQTHVVFTSREEKFYVTNRCRPLPKTTINQNGELQRMYPYNILTPKSLKTWCKRGFKDDKKQRIWKFCVRFCLLVMSELQTNASLIGLSKCKLNRDNTHIYAKVMQKTTGSAIQRNIGT